MDDISCHSNKLRQDAASDAQAIKLRFSPELLRSFARLEAAVHKSEHFDPEALTTLQDYEDAKPRTIESTLSWIAIITKETMKHVNATGDSKAEEALNDVIRGLGERSSSLEQPITVVGKQINKSR